MAAVMRLRKLAIFQEAVELRLGEVAVGNNIGVTH